MGIKIITTTKRRKLLKQIQKRKLREEISRMGLTTNIFGQINLTRTIAQAKPSITEIENLFKIFIYDNADYKDWSNLLERSKYKWIVELWGDEELKDFPYKFAKLKEKKQ